MALIENIFNYSCRIHLFIFQFIFIASSIGFTIPQYNEIKTTTTGQVFGWLIVFTPVVIILFFGYLSIFGRSLPSREGLISRVRVCILLLLRDACLFIITFLYNKLLLYLPFKILTQYVFVLVDTIYELPPGTNKKT